MNRRFALIPTIVAVLLVLGSATWWRARPPGGTATTREKKPAAVPTVATKPAVTANARAAATASATRRDVGLAAAEKTGRVEKIRRDYDEIRTKAAAEYAAAGGAFPGGLNGFLQQLALLEREKRFDLLTVLTSAELEDFELRETHAGQLVQQRLGDTTATDEQRRAVFRLQREFDEKWGLTFDTTPAGLLAREEARAANLQQITQTLEDLALRAAWLRDDEPEFGRVLEYAAQRGISPEIAAALSEARQAFTLERLRIAAASGKSAEGMRAGQNALVQRTRSRVAEILGPAMADSAARDWLGWLPQN